ncbi:MAG: hypothetical protein GY928_25980 [Colwellia sp.]|nr:hypothetical protein [Colwellia sp.]
MNIDRDFIDTVNDKADFDNFSEEVEILSSAQAGNVTIYTVTNKNGVTFQKVPGQAGLSDRGFMGYVNGDRARPIMLTGAAKTTTTESTNNDVTQGDSGGTSFADVFPVSLTPSVMYDIELTASAGGLGSDTATGTITVV